VDDPAEAAGVTARGNLVAVISNGTAVLGLGAIGPLASKPVMEGKAVLFKKFAGIDVFDIEVDERDVDRNSATSSRPWSRPSAASIWRTSRRPSASRSSGV
jgi:malate dehydrogenase (oxaloacetate-decarboxylating)(NADP+)